MKVIIFLIGLSLALVPSHALAKDYVLLDSDKPAQNWKITSQELGLNPEKPFSVSMRTLHGGRQEGVCIIDIDNGAMKISVVPTRGMNVMDAVDRKGAFRMGFARERSGESSLYRAYRSWRRRVAGRF